MKTFYAIKENQAHTYDADGRRLLITKLSAKPLQISQVKTVEKDGYQALQVAIGHKKRLTKPLKGHLKNISLAPKYLREIKLDSDNQKKLNEYVQVDEVFQIGDKVQVSSKR